MTEGKNELCALHTRLGLTSTDAAPGLDRWTIARPPSSRDTSALATPGTPSEAARTVLPQFFMLRIFWWRSKAV